MDDEDADAVGAPSVSNLTRAQLLEAMGSSAPVFGGRRQWLDYVGETTRFGSVELSGTSAHRVTLVRPGDATALAEHHRLVRTGRLAPTWPRRPLGADRLHVLERDDLRHTRADALDSWLVLAQGVARLCGTDDEVAHLAGGPLHRVLWSGRTRLDAPDVLDALAELHRAAAELAVERTSYRAAVERMVHLGRPASAAGTQPHAADELVRADLESIRLEIRTLAAVRTEWDDPA